MTISSRELKKILNDDDNEMTLPVAIAVLAIAFGMSLLIVKLLTIIVPGLAFWPTVGILWLLKFFF